MRVLPKAVAMAAALFSGLSEADTCSDVQSLTSVDVSRPLFPSYHSEQKEYWSASCSRLKPTCIIFPTTADEVAAIVNILKDNDDEFAVKSGGHNPNNYFASVDTGPLISTAKLDQVNLDPETGVVRLGPGLRLDAVAASLDGTGWTVVGGRIGNTGVGGLLLGGGISYMSSQYGWASASILEFEVVLGDGSIVTASEDENADLFVALKGGGNNFGIVTSFVAQAHKQDDIYGGNLIFVRSRSTDSQILQAVRDFTEYNTDDKAAVIVTAQRTALGIVDSWVLFIFYDGTDVPEGTFSNFTDAGPILNTAKVQSYSSLIGGSNWVIIPGITVQGGLETMPLPSAEHGTEVLETIHEHWRDVSKTRLAVTGYVAALAYMPWPRRIQQAARARGQDLYGVDDNHDRLMLELTYYFALPVDYDRMDSTMQETYGGIRDLILDFQSEGKLEDDIYLPLFLNYAYFRQDYFGRLKPESVDLARNVSNEYDPDGLFRNRTGGFRP